MPASTTTAPAAVTASRWASRRCNPRRRRRRGDRERSRGRAASAGTRRRPDGRRCRRRRRAPGSAAPPSAPGTARHRLCCRAGPCSATIAFAWSSDAPLAPAPSRARAARRRSARTAPVFFRAVHGLREALAQRAVVIDEGIADVGERNRQPENGRIGVDPTGGEIVEQCPQVGSSTTTMLTSARIRPSPGSVAPIACLGNGRPRPRHASVDRGVPAGGVLRALRHVHRAGAAHAGRLGQRRDRRLPGRCPTSWTVAAAGEVDCGVVPIENPPRCSANFYRRTPWPSTTTC